MSEDSTRYDVAISFLIEDLAIAHALHDKLAEGLQVFFFPRNQEDLAGTDGLESMRAPFRNESRLNVVVYRQRWGHTKWTAVEEIAIKESCLDNAFRNVFFYVVENPTTLPKWVPGTHVYFSSSHYTLEEAVGAIKSRVADQGGEFKPLTPVRKAELLNAEQQFRYQRSSMLSGSALDAIYKELNKLYAAISKQCDDVTGNGFQIRHRIDVEPQRVHQDCFLAADQVGMVITWHQRYTNALEDARLYLREFNQNIILPEGYRHIVQPEIIKETKYLPEVSRSLQYGWSQEDKRGSFWNTEEFAAKCVMSFLDLIERDRSGKINRKGWR
jgi:hypothetical protein